MKTTQNCGQLQINTCRNNQCLLLNLVHRQTSVYSTDKTFAVHNISIESPYRGPFVQGDHFKIGHPCSREHNPS